MNKLNQSMTISNENQYAYKWAELLGMFGYRCTSSKRNIKNNICRTRTNEQEGKLLTSELNAPYRNMMNWELKKVLNKKYGTDL
jgi:hypothetical protein